MPVWGVHFWVWCILGVFIFWSDARFHLLGLMPFLRGMTLFGLMLCRGFLYWAWCNFGCLFFGLGAPSGGSFVDLDDMCCNFECHMLKLLTFLEHPFGTRPPQKNRQCHTLEGLVVSKFLLCRSWTDAPRGQMRNDLTFSEHTQAKELRLFFIYIQLNRRSKCISPKWQTPFLRGH